jgi:matrixin
MPNALVAGTTLRIAAGETGEGVDGAVVTVAGRSYTSAGGEVTLAEAAPLRSEITIVAPDMLERRTLVRDVATTRFTLWPRTSVTGIDEAFTQELVYARSDGLGPLRRLPRGTTRVVVVPSEELRGIEAAMAAHQDAVDRVTAATDGQVAYVLGSAVPPSGVYVETRIGGSDDGLCSEANVLAFAQATTQNDEIVRGQVVYCDPKAARNAVVAHELGHTFGLFHSPEKGELMYRFFNGHGAVEFGPRESLEMRLMLQRLAGNVFPDDDRTVGAAGARTYVTVCRDSSS